LSRTQKFIEDNQKLLILGAAVAVSAGAGYYLYNRSSDGKPGSSGSSSSSSTGAAAGAKKNKNKKKKKSTGDKGLKGEGLEGPLLEEIEPKPAAVDKSEGPEHLKGLFGSVISRSVVGDACACREIRMRADKQECPMRPDSLPCPMP
jgi:import receptor subunit TOM70